MIGIVARLSAQKAHHVLLEAFAVLRGSQPEARLVVVGGGPREQELRELATELGLGDSIQFTGMLRDVPAVLPAFDVSCLSSVHEGVPIALIEAMAAGVPIVASDCGAVRDIVEDGKQGYLVPVGDVDRFADRLHLLAGDANLRARLGKAGRARAEGEFDIERTARAYEDLLAELVARA